MVWTRPRYIYSEMDIYYAKNYRDFVLLYHLYFTWRFLYILLLEMLYDSTNDPSYVQTSPELLVNGF